MPGLTLLNQASISADFRSVNKATSARRLRPNDDEDAERDYISGLSSVAVGLSKISPSAQGPANKLWLKSGTDPEKVFNYVHLGKAGVKFSPMTEVHGFVLKSEICITRHPPVVALQQEVDVYERWGQHTKYLSLVLRGEGLRSTLCTRFNMSMVLGLVFGVADVGVECTSYQGIKSGMGMIFVAASYITFFTFSGVIPALFKYRAAFYRERAAETYSVLSYLTGAVLLEIPYCF
ncbi:hypothetical protein ON010_g18286 [Phytophthora cinnamomi]|nr:hypothetical protein ON010_g18286 [Phytophthora cinnamomi]